MLIIVASVATPVDVSLSIRRIAALGDGWGPLPAALNRSEGRRLARQATGKSSIPLLVTGDGETIAGSTEIVVWAAQRPALSS